MYVYVSHCLLVLVLHVKLLGSETARASLLYSMEQATVQGWVGLDQAEEASMVMKQKPQQEVLADHGRIRLDCVALAVTLLQYVQLRFLLFVLADNRDILRFTSAPPALLSGMLRWSPWIISGEHTTCMFPGALRCSRCATSSSSRSKQCV